MARTRKPRKPLTDAEREARAADQARWSEAADAMMNSDDGLAAVVAAMIRRPSLARFSPHNVALILVQAAERGITAPHLQTPREWRSFGRRLDKGTRAFGAVVHIGSGDAATDPAATGGPSPVVDLPTVDHDGTKPKRSPFRWRRRWFDVTDTSPDPEREPGAEVPAEPENGALAVSEALSQRLERAGYTVHQFPDTEPHAEPIEIDDQAKTVHVYVADPDEPHPADATADPVLIALAALVHAISAPSARAPRPAAADPDADVVVTLTDE